MATTPIFTFQDVCESLFVSFNPGTKPPTGRELQATRRAIVSAYRDLSQRHNWVYYQRHKVLHADAEYGTGTVAYDHTGGTYERQLTLSDGTWPANAARGMVSIDNCHYPVEERKSDTVVTLNANANPGADIAAGETYLWYRNAYPLPTDFRRIRTIGETSTSDEWYPLEYLSPSTAHQALLASSGTYTDRPEWYSIRNEGDYLGTLSLILSPAPDTARTYDILYDVNPRELVTYEESTGTLSITAGAVAVTGSGTAFNARHVGSIIRFTTSTTVEPTAPEGHVDGTTNPFLAQRTIMSVASATSLTIDSAVSATTTLTGTKFVISDPVDVEPIVMRSALESLAMAYYAKITKREDFPKLQAIADRDIIYAMGSDCRSMETRSGMQGGNPSGWESRWGTVDSEPTE